MGTSRQPIRFISVDFPEPEVPMMAANSPGCDRKVDPLEDLHGVLSHPEGLPDIFHQAQGGHGRFPFAFFFASPSGAAGRTSFVASSVPSGTPERISVRSSPRMPSFSSAFSTFFGPFTTR